MRNVGRVLITDRHDWTDEEILSAYRGQSQAEASFRQLKDDDHLALRPQFHWTDQKIRVHAFYCVLALTLTSLLQRTLHQQGLDLSMDRALELLSGIQEVLLVYPRQPGQQQPPTATCLSELDAEQQPLFAKLNLSRYQRA